MLNTVKNKHKLNKWFYFIPVIGTIIYSLIFEFCINKIVIDGNKEFKKIRKYKSIVNLISISTSLVFVILFFVFRNKNGYGSFPWFFWVGMGIGLGQNIVPFLPWYLYKVGIKKFEKNNKKQ